MRQNRFSQQYTSFVHHSNTDARHVSGIKLHGTEILGESCFVCCKVSQYQPSGEGGPHSPPATPHRLQCRTACKIQNGHQGAPKWPMGSGKVSTPRFLGILSNFHKISYFDPSTSLLLGDHPPTESGKCVSPRRGVLSNFHKISFLIRALLLREK